MVSISHIGSYPTPTLGDPLTGLAPRRLLFEKHTAMAFCPDNGKIYLAGGDGTGHHFTQWQSGSMDTMATYDIATHTYTEDFPYQGAVGEVTPRGLDFIPLIWVQTLREFWVGSGFAWNYGVDVYPWLDTSWTHGSYASYNPATRKFTNRGSRGAAAGTLPEEGIGGSWNSRLNVLMYAVNQGISFVDPATRQVTRRNVAIPSYRPETSPTWYDAEADEFYFIQVALGKVWGHKVTANTTRLVADVGLPAPIESSSSRACVFITDAKYLLIVYAAWDMPSNRWKLINLTTGEISQFDAFVSGRTYHNGGCYHPPSKTILLIGGGAGNGEFFYEYKVESDVVLPPENPDMPTPQELVASGEAHLNLLYENAGMPSLTAQLAALQSQVNTLTASNTALQAKLNSGLVQAQETVTALQ